LYQVADFQISHHAFKIMAQFNFHFTCFDCLGQQIYGKERCTGCAWFERDTSLPSLRVSKEEFDSIQTEEARRSLKGLEFSDRDREEFLQEVKEQIRDREIESHMKEMESLNSMRRYSNELVEKTLEALHRKRRLDFFRNLAIVAGLTIALLLCSAQ